MATIAQIMAKKMFGESKQQPDQDRLGIDNPLDAVAGSLLKIEHVDLPDEALPLVSVRASSVSVGSEQFRFVDYEPELVVDKDGDKVQYRVRVILTDEGLKFMLMMLDGELPFDVEFEKKAYLDPIFRIANPNPAIAGDYTRINDVQTSYHSTVNVVAGLNGPAQSKKRQTVEFRDWSRQAEVDGVSLARYVYVEKNFDLGMFQVWVAEEIDQSQVQRL